MFYIHTPYHFLSHCSLHRDVFFGKLTDADLEFFNLRNEYNEKDKEVLKIEIESLRDLGLSTKENIDRSPEIKQFMTDTTVNLWTVETNKIRTNNTTDGTYQ